MSTGTNQGFHLFGAEDLRRTLGWFVGVGILLVIVGLIALSSSVVATMASVAVFGWLLLFSGVLSLVHAFMRRRWGGFFLELFAGILGVIMLANPARAAVALTLLIALLLMVGGAFRIIAALSVRFHHWVWMLVNGVISVILGILIFSEWPSSGLWVIGLFIGIDLVFYGWSLIMLGLTVRGTSRSPV